MTGTTRSTTDTARCHLTFHVTTSDRQRADEAASDAYRVLDSVWIGRDVAVLHLMNDVWAVTVTFYAPVYEVREDAPIVRTALLAAQHIAPCDTVSMWNGAVRL